jgi:alpha-beta hydrolase superfamily lysophospholipase
MFNKHFNSFEEYSKLYNLDFNGVDHRYFEFKSDGHNLIGQTFVPKEYRATLIIVHGFLQHSGTFGKFIKYMLDNRFAIAMFDLPGHGLSDGDQTAIDNFSQYSLALEEFMEIIKPQLHGPYNIIGHSMGGAVVMDHLIQSKNGFDKIILAAPLIRCTLWTLSKIGCMIYSPFMKNIFRVFRNISSDEEYVRFVKHSDPLQAKFISLKWVKAMFKWDKKIARVADINKPLLVIQGTDDTTVAWKYNLPFIMSKFKNADLEFIENAQHEFFNEVPQYREQVFSIIRDYLVMSK